jgi:hypothetical protein
MYDLWYTLGVAVIRPELLDAIKAAGPVYDLIDRYVIEVQKGEQTLRPKDPRAGLLEHNPTTNVRVAIAKFVKQFSPSAPPIGIYTAGRFCELVLLPNFASALPSSSSMKDVINLAHTAYDGAIGHGPQSTLPTFPAFLGLCMMDGNFVAAFKKPTTLLKQAVSEFGITIDPKNLEWQIANLFVKAQEFRQAVKLFMASDMTGWTSNTADQIFFWDGFTEHAIP